MDMRRQYKEVADRFLNGIMLDSRCQGVMYLGGLARDFADEFSDIDIAVFSEEKLSDLHLGERLTPENYDLEIFSVAMNEGFEKWTPIQKEAYGEGVIVADKNGMVADFIKKALHFSDEYRIKRAMELIFQIAWHGWVYTPYKYKTIKGYTWLLPEDLWFRRNEDKNAFFTAQQSISHLIDLIFVLNRRWTPDYKWRYIRSLKLPIVPNDFAKKIDYLLYETWNLETWTQKRDTLQNLVDETIELLMPDLPMENWYDIIDH
jgi:predicted nucleotidyltransferase